MAKKDKKAAAEQPEATEEATAVVDTDAMEVDSPKPAKKSKRKSSTTGGANGDDEEANEDGKASHTYESRLTALSPIAHPLAGKKLTKKVLKTVRKAAKGKSIKRGVKEVVKGLRKGHKGVVIIAGDISPIDVITHIPILCEENNVPYVYVPSKEDLGFAGVTKRPTSCVMIQCKEDFKALYDEINTEVGEMNATLITAV
ncbi:hypothetical protein SmJEL517_g02507 [Synchytrium microbalum]|uniref:H/ACA ribonucleoprotein complex subunit 2 n=1 Tax=Synchytrium microbalum TaxID=1806994 RepID=A0A507CC09_9FUNG|nr:uncharacterized protein SmJEL517_g02507 [Synchytrium microbalum]TPX35083.1 hypothetical protein SmJEL517_g02507 [Synchytrium microbalum]